MQASLLVVRIDLALKGQSRTAPKWGKPRPIEIGITLSDVMFYNLRIQIGQKATP